MTDKDFYGGLIRLHILHHVAEKPIFGLGIIKELRYHGYKLSTGTLYPMLHGLEKKGCFSTRHEHPGRRDRRVDEITKQGHVALADAKVKVKELFRELIEGVDILKEIVDGIA
ncbi:PadR family transcriptional regulator [Nitrosomonas sp. Nm34]|uniref:PadR family transcriptional regulator n=1 Tax=Nitrosomonas sp. Nm34 TaxID=1881055 RepID=UPI0008DEB95E|nr:PadR family transcriptional regulator [Nitrosomonas sp. Nm34]SFJ01806.1 DNA-binding transcriptional regulator, PadR family [Nitrosomonas sp. Nm34]